MLSDTNNNDVFAFMKCPDKFKKLTNTNNLLNINNNNHNKLLFVYSAPKVGSTSIVSSFRIFGIDKLDIIHIHDEEMLNVLVKIKDITINEIILFNKYLGKDVYVINIYRSPIERKISTFFEKIGSFHFNANDEEVNKYNINKVIQRFNNIFPWIGNGDHFIDKYNIQIPNSFDNINKYLLVTENNIKYITLRLKDSDEWDKILTSIFGFDIKIIKDYESSKKPIKDLYNLFKKNYKIPINHLNEILNDKHFKYYYSQDEIDIYYKQWLEKSTDFTQSYTYEQYKLYENISIENYHIDRIQLDHYFDEGCICKACSIKRSEIKHKILKNIKINDRAVHVEAKNELIQKRIIRANKINNMMKNLPTNVVTRKDFKNDMQTIISNKYIK